MNREHTALMTITVRVRPIQTPPEQAKEWLASFVIGGFEHCEHGESAWDAVFNLQRSVNRGQERWLDRLKAEHDQERCMHALRHGPIEEACEDCRRIYEIGHDHGR